MTEFSHPEDAHMHMSSVTPAEDVRTVLINNVSWGAVLAGVVFALVVLLLLNLLGIGIGVATIHPANSAPDTQSFTLGAGIWWTVSGIVAAYAGGLVAGRLSGRPRASTTAWHGVTSWALTTLVAFWLLTTPIGGVLGGGLNVLGVVAAAAGTATTDSAATLVSRAALFGFVSLVLGGIAAWFGGRMGSVDPTIRGYIDERGRATTRVRTPG